MFWRCPEKVKEILTRKLSEALAMCSDGVRMDTKPQGKKKSKKKAKKKKGTDDSECFENIFRTFMSGLQSNLHWKLHVKFIMRRTMFNRKGINFANQYMEFIVLAAKGVLDKLVSSDLDPLKDLSWRTRHVNISNNNLKPPFY
ncbi:hypothetical protein llap_6193 [Limosa lapponica baueri]|uniref:Uncharacterized protein n=1 Tax=Limosa lapponica baueri TaxID=1758121 RepID=A0A2I0UBU5_LIMLA|nr:hypothetical protein llap_6193 [Limosa lapponica baueri]